MIKQCKQCGKDFEATMRQKFCPECKKIRKAEQNRRYVNSEPGQAAKERYNAKRRKNPKLIKPKPKPPQPPLPRLPLPVNIPTPKGGGFRQLKDSNSSGLAYTASIL